MLKSPNFSDINVKGLRLFRVRVIRCSRLTERPRATLMQRPWLTCAWASEGRARQLFFKSPLCHTLYSDCT